MSQKHHLTISPTMSEQKLKSILAYVHAELAQDEIIVTLSEPDKFTFTAKDIVERVNISYGRLSQLTNGRIKYKKGTKEIASVEKPLLENNVDYIRQNVDAKTVVLYAESALLKLYGRTTNDDGADDEQ